MENENDLTKCYEILKLDERASLNEVCIAFDVLTKSEKDISKIQQYRNAFECIMFNKAPQLFESDDTPIEIPSDNIPIEIPQKSENEQDTNQDSGNTLNAIKEHDVFTIGDEIPVNCLMSFIESYKRKFLNTEYIKVDDLRDYIKNQTMYYDTTIVFTTMFKSDRDSIKKDLDSILKVMHETYNISYTIANGKNVVCIKTMLPYDLYCVLVSVIDGYCANINFKYTIKAKISTLGC